MSRTVVKLQDSEHVEPGVNRLKKKQQQHELQTPHDAEKHELSKESNKLHKHAILL